jgi:peptidoglycan/LPS O-acetylase OafA/YrhL
MVLVFLVGEGPPNPVRQPPAVVAEFIAMFLMLAGFLVGWRWEGAGGLIAIGGFALFSAAEFVANGKPPHGAVPLFAIPGVFYLASYCTGRLLTCPPNLRQPPNMGYSNPRDFD